MHCPLLDVMGNVKKREHIGLSIRKRIMKWRQSGKDVYVGIKLNKCNQRCVNYSGKKKFLILTTGHGKLLPKKHSCIHVLSQGTKLCERDFSSSIPISPSPWPKHLAQEMFYSACLSSWSIHNKIISTNFFHSGKMLETSGYCQQMLTNQLSRNKYWQGMGASLENPCQPLAREDLFQGLRHVFSLRGGRGLGSSSQQVPRPNYVPFSTFAL